MNAFGISPVATLRLSFASTTAVRNTDSKATVGLAASSLLMCCLWFLPSAQVLPLISPSFFSFRKVTASHLFFIWFGVRSFFLFGAKLSRRCICLSSLLIASTPLSPKTLSPLFREYWLNTLNSTCRKVISSTPSLLTFSALLAILKLLLYAYFSPEKDGIYLLGCAVFLFGVLSWSSGSLTSSTSSKESSSCDILISSCSISWSNFSSILFISCSSSSNEPSRLSIMLCKSFSSPSSSESESSSLSSGS